jgi:hypothetical protein
VQFVAFEVGAAAHQMFLGALYVVRGLDARQWKVNAFGRAVRPWRLFVLHCVTYRGLASAAARYSCLTRRCLTASPSAG